MNLSPLPSFKFAPARDVSDVFEPFMQTARTVDSHGQASIDECALQSDPVKAVLQLAAVYLDLQGPVKSAAAFEAVKPLRTIALERRTQALAASDAEPARVRELG